MKPQRPPLGSTFRYALGERPETADKKTVPCKVCEAAKYGGYFITGDQRLLARSDAIADILSTPFPTPKLGGAAAGAPWAGFSLPRRYPSTHVRCHQFAELGFISFHFNELTGAAGVNRTHDPTLTKGVLYP